MGRPWTGQLVLALLALLSSGCPWGKKPEGNRSEDRPKRSTARIVYDPVAERPQGCEGSCGAGLCDETCPERRVRLSEQPLGLRHAPNLLAWLSADGEVFSLSPSGTARRRLPLPATAVAIRADEVLAADKQGSVRVLRLRQEPVIADLNVRVQVLVTTPNMLGWFPDRATPPKTNTGAPGSLGVARSFVLHVTSAGVTRPAQPDSITRNVVASEARFAFTHDREVYVVDEVQPAYRVYRSPSHEQHVLSLVGRQFVVLGVHCDDDDVRDSTGARVRCMDRTDDRASAILSVLTEDGATREVAQSPVRPWCATANDRVAVWCLDERVEAIELSSGRKKLLTTIPRAARPSAATLRPVSTVYSLASDGSLVFAGDEEMRVRGLDWGAKP